jgi:D-arabinose 1-dehydrogenase-like Zn-dependent alcohol dehydrogenase
MRRAEYRFDLLLFTAHVGFDWDALLMILKKNGRLVLVAFPQVALDSIDLVVRRISITGSFMGDHAAMREMPAFADAHGIVPQVEMMPVAQVNKAIQRLSEDRARYWIVLADDPDNMVADTEHPA